MSRLPIGLIEEKIPRLDALMGLFDNGSSAHTALSVFSESFNRKHTARMVWLEPVHSVVFAPIGVGKGTSLIIPFLNTCHDSCVIVDFKAENAVATMSARRKMGHKVALIDPFKVISSTPHSYNPISCIDPDSPIALDEIRDVVEALVIRQPDEKDPHWNNCAITLITGLIGAVVAFGEPETKNLQTVRALLTSTEKMNKIVEMMITSDVWGGMLARLGGQIKQFEGKELASILTTANRHMTFLDSVPVSESTRTSNWEPKDLLRGKMTVYLVLPPAHQRSQSSLIRLWVSSLMRLVVNGGMSKRKVHFVLDESAALGHLECLEDAVDKYRAYGIRCQFYCQSLGQLRACWPEGKDQVLLSNTTKIFMGVNDYPTAEFVSNSLGNQTIIVNSGGTSDGRSSTSSSDDKGSTGCSTSVNHNWSQTKRSLLEPAEVMALDPRVAITFHPGVRPIMTWLVRYYEWDFQRENGIGVLRVMGETLCLFLTAMIFAIAAVAMAFKGGW